MKAARFFSLFIVLVMLLSAVTVTTSAAGYNDVSTTRWSYEDIIYASNKGYMNGVGDGRFNPTGTMQRAMIVTVLYRMEGEPAVTYTKRFSDVPDGKYYSKAVIWAANAKIVTGATQTTFNPTGAVTREQMATFFCRYAAYKNIYTERKADITSFSDYTTISSYAVDAFAWANEVGLISGDTATTLSPKKPATREQFSAILHRYDTTDKEYTKEYALPVMKSSFTPKEYPTENNADFYVSTKGSDTNDGSFSHPFKTFERAKAAVKELKNTKVGEIVVAFMAGDYGRLNISFDSSDSGTAETPITYCAYGDGEVNFVNGATIKQSEFTPIDSSDYHLFNSKYYGDIYKADISDKVNVNDINDNSCLFGDGFTCVSARYPNQDSDGEDTFISSYQKIDDRTIKLIPAFAKKFASYQRVSDIKVNGYFNYEWGSESALPIASYNPETLSITFAKDTFWGIGDSNNGHFYYYNVPEELDTSGEYYIDTETGMLYVYKPVGDYNLAVYGTFLNINANYLTFRGMNFTATTARPVILFGDHDTLESCNIIGVAADVSVRMGGSNHTIDSCEIAQMNAGGIMCGGGDRTTLTRANILITNCSIHDFGLVSKSYAAGFGFADGDGVGITFSHNEVYNCPHVAISYGGVDSVIEYNVIHDACRGAADMGAMYSGRTLLNRDMIIRYNVFYNIGEDSGSTVIYLDDGLSGQTIYGNMFFKSNGWGCISVGGGRENYLCDNIMINTEKNETPAIACFAKYYDAAVTGSMEETSSFVGLLESYTDKEEFLRNDPLWSLKYPHLAALVTDPFDITNPDCITCPSYCTIKNNYCVGKISHSIDEAYSVFGEVENNISIPMQDCDMFVDPINGDYTLKPGAFTLDIPFDQIGRY